MNTHSDGKHFQLFVKERLSLELESATPAVDQPVAKVDKGKWERWCCFSLWGKLWSTAATLPLLLYPKQNKGFTNKEEL